MIIFTASQENAWEQILRKGINFFAKEIIE